MWKEAEPAMTPENDHISHRQLLALSFLCLLSPTIRRVPRIVVSVAGYASWLSTLLAFLPLVLLIFFMCSFLKTKSRGVGLAELFLRALGVPVGKLVLLLYSLWLLLYDSFLLRSGAHRFVSTIYPHAQPWVFVAVMLVLCLIAALGSLRALSRAATVFRPLLLAAFVIILLFALQNVDFSSFLPLNRTDVVPVLTGALPLVNAGSIVAYLAFFMGHVDGPPPKRPLICWLLVFVVLTTLICLITVGVFGPEFVSKSHNAFFIMVRDISILNTVERVEAVVVALWVFTDFVLETALLLIVVGNLRLCLNIAPHPDRKPGVFDFTHGRWLISRDSFALVWFSETLVPKLNLGFVFIGLPVIWLIGKLRNVL
jgi:hypothetical protein